MKNIMYFENFKQKQAQDILSLPTTLKKPKYYIKRNDNVQDTSSISTPVTDKMFIYENKLQPYYDYIRKIKGIYNLSPITYEEVEKLIGFSFLADNNKVMILTDGESIYLLIKDQVIPVSNPIEMMDVIISEI